ncbi:MAG TPA: ABC transporter ATP-binding protein [Candidatus Limihabitans stercoravium]|nr:ABC transporter ATP-binding protein [Candidatus Limihabitans stercoravium]
MQEILKFENVRQVFYTDTQETVAIDNLSFSVNKGEFAALLGPSGCGKTTVLSLICKLLKPTEGKVEILSDNPNAVGYMLQHDHLFGWRTIEKNILLGLEIAGKVTPEQRKYAADLMDKYGLGEFKNHYPAQLSGGMRQRTALIRTLATRPDILLLDEPFSALDYQTRLDVCEDVYSIIKKENKTALLVTHDISEAISLADVIYVLTARPSTLKATHLTNMQHIDSPLKRRESPDFSRQFQLLYNYLNGGDK